MIRRRAALLLPLLPAAAAAQAVPRLLAHFLVLREGSEVGRHVVTAAETDLGTVVTSDLDIHVRLAGFTVFRSRVLTRERLSGGALAEFSAEVLRDGRTTRLSVLPGGAGLRAEGPEGASDLPRDALPLAWWFPERFGRTLFEPETGARITGRVLRTPQPGGGVRVSIEGRQPEAVATYDARNRWVGFATRGSDGSAVTYRAA
ncbi:MAG: hypothetical protein N2Z67_05345 [Acetobacteraceae bacterium]|nr:hypothetical protein [Acetobacteraceae bacterium]